MSSWVERRAVVDCSGKNCSHWIEWKKKGLFACEGDELLSVFMQDKDLSVLGLWDAGKGCAACIMFIVSHKNIFCLFFR